MTDAEITVALLRESRETLNALYEEAQLEVPSVDQDGMASTATTLEKALRELATTMQELLAESDRKSR